ncbi:uncharacterized protein LOC114141274 [Xiphophorus couchianus]|uniref:uncharacterized protein LOC114141274 n=1 Tax=Xiphophorus couchianus TaxID=32473 RepID=UPI001016C4F2|nr:uncharacterized protein LOC114141274 [Xiphophorus couchianus]
MVCTCVIQGCGKRPEPYVRNLHGFPNNLETTKAWNDFVKRTRPTWNGNTPSSRVCSEHFQPDCYKNHLVWSMKWVRTLDLKDDFQVPTIYPAAVKKSPVLLAKDDRKAGRDISPIPPGSSNMLASVEIKKEEEESPCSGATMPPPIQECHVKTEYQMMYFVRHVASQTDPPSISPNTRSVGTQVTRIPRQIKVQTTGSQVIFNSQHRIICSDPLKSPLLLLQPTLVKRPSKRLRLGLEYEEEAVQDKTSST